MVEVTHHNFDEILHEFEHTIQKCSFFSIDCEYTSLPTIFSNEKSFFDYGEDIYSKIRECVGSSLIIQVGITPFRFYRELNHFKAKPFNFYVFPKPFGKFNVSMFCKSSTIQFLCTNKFNFNKVFYEGVSYMNKTECNKIIKELQEGTLLNSVEKNLDYEDSDDIIKTCGIIKKWSSAAAIGDLFEVTCKPNYSYNFALREEICILNKDVWTTMDNKKIKVQKVNQEERLKFENIQDKLKIQETVLSSVIGFSKVIEILSDSRKPLVGHNVFLDLLTIYHQFHEDLPASYSIFKTNLLRLFPVVYDTKLIAFEILRSKTKENLCTSLGAIFESYQNRGTLFYAPTITLDSEGIYLNDEDQQPHDAGWDSYMTGFIFLKMADELTRIKRKSKYSMNVSSMELFSSVDPWKNLVCLSRSKISHVNLGGKDPDSRRPPLLHVRHIKNKCLSAIELDATFKKYEPLHKKSLNMHSVLIAVPNFSCFKKILIDFSNSPELKVEEYSLFKHHRGFRACIIAGVLVPAIISVWFGFKPH